MSLRSTVVLVVLLAACNKAKSASPGAPGGGGGMPPMPLEVAVAIHDTVVDAVQATGQIEAVPTVPLPPEVPGRITDIPVRGRQGVGTGTPLLQMDDGQLQGQGCHRQTELPI